MKKIFVTVLGLFLFVGFANAQSLGVGAELSLPMGTFGDQAGMGFGGSVRGELELSDNMNGMLTVGYLTYGGKEVDFGGGLKDDWSWSAITILAGAKYYLGSAGFYTMAETGFHMWTAEYVRTYTPAVGYTSTLTVDASSTEFSYGLGFGYEIPMGANSLDLNAKYEGAGSGISYVGARVAYRFSL
ncbi:MAG: hypothetical protein K9J16_10460 [Melioribacteraceae bacterium]|nr:hypothetical protein [Melioribacteraceae bacterium]MCF8354980.1 hypothetical protein [Melioribacteraceae bacterium]MCF8394003.1 hypothetical protein [Melioribacteraceae bacterium]MCF8419794.1 hypothetical protein [Melioribacteraceae bacterium]